MILLAAPGCHRQKPGETRASAKPPPLPADVTPPPPASQFREGDRWRSWGFDAAGRQTNSFRTFYVHDGAWYRLPGDIDKNAGPADARSFQQLKDPVFYPAGATENDFFATVDGTLHRYVRGQWTDLPIGATLVDQRGTVYKVDVRVTPYEADQLQEAFVFTKPTFRALGERRDLPILLPRRDQLADAGDTTAASAPASPSVVTPPPSSEAPAPASAAPGKSMLSGLSLRWVLLVVLLGGIGLLILRNLRAGR